jgi:hypothetical protein
MKNYKNQRIVGENGQAWTVDLKVSDGGSPDEHTILITGIHGSVSASDLSFLKDAVLNQYSFFAEPTIKIDGGEA